MSVISLDYMSSIANGYYVGILKLSNTCITCIKVHHFIFVLIKTVHLVSVINGVICAGVSTLCAIICYLLLLKEQLCVGFAPLPLCYSIFTK